MTAAREPVAIFRHSPTEGPGYFATFLDAHEIPWALIAIDAGDAVPVSISGFSGLCFMGGPMSVNDDLPWIEPVLALIRKAVAQGKPVIGHCLGGQLMSKALGASVGRNPVKEIGWGEVRTTDPASQEWMGETAAFEAFHWHGETFTLPAGAIRILQSAWCANQAWVRGPHIAMQCHVEMTEDMIRTWCDQWELEKARPRPSVQTPSQIFDGMAVKITKMHATADRIYTRWIKSLE